MKSWKIEECPHCGARDPHREMSLTPGLFDPIYVTTYLCCGEQDFKVDNGGAV